VLINDDPSASEEPEAAARDAMRSSTSASSAGSASRKCPSHRPDVCRLGRGSSGGARSIVWKMTRARHRNYARWRALLRLPRPSTPAP
jgi:hypothetical protein